MRVTIRDPEKERPLFDYQKTTFDLMVEQFPHRPYYGIFYQMRLGKTLLTIRFCKHLNLCKVLIVCPLSIAEPTWKIELQKENIYPFLFTDSYFQRMRSRQHSCLRYDSIDEIWDNPNCFVITNYEHLRSTKSGLHEREWDCVIIDESTKLANPNNKISRFCCTFFRDAKCRIILAGNPTPNSLADYFQQIAFLKGDMLNCRNWWEFTTHHFYGLKQGNKLKPYKQSVPLIEAELASFCYKLKRSDVNIGSRKIYKEIEIPFDEKFRTYYDYMEKNWALNETSTAWAIVAQNYLHQMCGGFPQFERHVESYHKIKELKGLLKGDLAGEKVVIWTKFRHEQSVLYNKIRDFIPETAVINSSVPIERRTQIINLFQTTPDINILICTYGTLDFGIDLSAADTTIYYSSPWSRLQREQSEDRIVHPTKHNPLLYIDLVSEDSVDVDVLAAHQAKIARTDKYNEVIYEKFLQRLINEPRLAKNEPPAPFIKKLQEQELSL